MATDASQIVYAVGRVEPTGLTPLGTAFAVADNRVATAYHVVGADDRNLALVFPRISSLEEYQDTSDTSIRMLPVTMVAVDPIRDLCILELAGDVSITVGYGLGSADSVPPGATVVTYGFPHANTGRLVLTEHVTQVGARVLIESQGQKSKHIVLNTQAREGQSGGPVFSPSSGHVVAVLLGSYAPTSGGSVIVAGINPATLHQTTHAISAEYLAPML